MPTATKTPETDVDAPRVTQQYTSTCANLRLVKDQIRRKQIGEGKDFTYTDGSVVEFLNGNFETAEPKLVDWLDGHHGAGILFHKIGFGADGHTGDDSARLVSEIIGMAFSGDYQKIADVMLAERNSYSRPDVLAACERILTEAAVETASDPDAAPAGS
jgi:hypothetical protein